MAPEEFEIEFSSVRHLTPRQFVEKVSKELRVHGVVAGENYWFGYKASGNASELVRLCEEYGMSAYIIKSVMDNNQDSGNKISSDLKERGQVSSTRVRHALAVGEVKYVSSLLGRPHRLILVVQELEVFTSSSSKYRVSASKFCLLNLPPKEGFYEKCSLIVGDKKLGTCSVFIDKTDIHLEMDEMIDTCNYINSQDFRLLGIEFGGS